MSGPNNGGRARHLEALRDSEELHRATLSAISDTVLLADDHGAFTFICPNIDIIFGYVPDEVQELGTIDRLLGPNLFDPEELAAKGEVRNVEREIITKSGDRRTVLIHFKRVSIKGGTVLCSCRDVTELKHAERELAATRLNLTHATRLTLIGQLLATIVHEVQQPLVAIGLNANAGLKILQDPAPGDDAAKLSEILDEIHRASGSASAIIVRLRQLAKKRPIQLQPLDLNDAISDVLGLVRAELLRRGVTLDLDLEASLPAVRGDRISLQQVILDLVINAMEAMQDHESGRLLNVRTRLGPHAVEIVVSDTGPGVPEEQKPRLFEPFFTTKREGLGLGLSTARSIMDAHGGTVRLEANAGATGAAFCVALPRLIGVSASGS